MKAIILAAGEGKRLKKHFNIPKSFIQIPKIGTTLIERNIDILRKYNVKRFIIVTGYKSNYFKKLVNKDIKLKKIDKYKKLNNYYSLLSVKNLLKGELIILFSDILVNQKILKNLCKIKKDICFVIDKNKKLKDTMRVILKKNKIVDVGSHIDPKFANGNFIGIAKYSAVGSKILNKSLNEDKSNFKKYYVRALDKAMKKNKVDYLDVNKNFWIEIDNEKDLKKLKFVNKKLLI